MHGGRWESFLELGILVWLAHSRLNVIIRKDQDQMKCQGKKKKKKEKEEQEIRK